MPTQHNLPDPTVPQGPGSPIYVRLGVPWEVFPWLSPTPSLQLCLHIPVTLWAALAPSVPGTLCLSGCQSLRAIMLPNSSFSCFQPGGRPDCLSQSSSGSYMAPYCPRSSAQTLLPTVKGFMPPGCHWPTSSWDPHAVRSGSTPLPSVLMSTGSLSLAVLFPPRHLPRLCPPMLLVCLDSRLLCTLQGTLVAPQNPIAIARLPLNSAVSSPRVFKVRAADFSRSGLICLQHFLCVPTCGAQGRQVLGQPSRA